MVSVKEPVKISSEVLKYKYSIIGGVFMTLNAAQIKTINTYLTKTYGETTLDGVKKTIVVYVDNKDRIYIKVILKEIQMKLHTLEYLFPSTVRFQ